MLTLIKFKITVKDTLPNSIRDFSSSVIVKSDNQNTSPTSKSFFPIFTLLKMKMSKWLKYLFIFSILLLLPVSGVLIFFYYPHLFSIYSSTTSHIVFWILPLSILILIVFMCYNILNVYYLNTYAKLDDKEIKFPKYLPWFIKNHLLELKLLSKGITFHHTVHMFTVGAMFTFFLIIFFIILFLFYLSSYTP